jgi:hypothetical protein
VIDVEQRALRAFEHDALTGLASRRRRARSVASMGHERAACGFELAITDCSGRALAAQARTVGAQASSA